MFGNARFGNNRNFGNNNFGNNGFLNSNLGNNNFRDGGFLPKVTFGGRSAADYADDTRPSGWLVMNLEDPYLVFEAEMDEDKSTYLDSGESTTADRRDLSPSVGISANGSFYHPNFLLFDVVLEQGITKGNRKITTTSGGTTEEDRDFHLQRYIGNLRFLSEKPLSLSLYGSSSQDRRDFDKFRSTTYRSEIYGSKLTYRSEHLPWILSYDTRSNEAINKDRPSIREEDRLSFQITNKRGDDRDKTVLRLNYTDTSQEEFQLSNFQSETFRAALSDEEYWGLHGRTRLLSDISYETQDYADNETSYIKAGSSLSHRHDRALHSAASYRMDNRETESTQLDRHFASYELNHQLYESLNSTFNMEAEFTSTKGDGFSQDYWRAGPGIFENYTKTLPADSRLRVDLGLRVQQEKQDNQGSTVRIENERIRMRDGQSHLLRKPNVQPGTIQVTDQSGSELFFEGLDYRVIQRGSFTEIQRVFAGRIPEGSVVLVDYSADAEASDNVTSSDVKTGFDLQLRGGLLNFYGDYRKVNNSGGQSLSFQDTDTLSLGTKVSYGIAEAGAEFSMHDSSSTEYEQVRFFQRLTWRVSENNYLSLDGSQSTSEYKGRDEKQDIEMYNVSYQTTPTRNLSVTLSGGYYQEDGLDFDRNLTSGELALDYRVGKVTLDGAMRYEKEEKTGEEREKKLVEVKMRRDF